ncbi:MAG: LCP family protein [bacterium]|nr:LCP family protein [bacterium]MDE0353273.1 LCP family protein [bacterium]
MSGAWMDLRRRGPDPLVAAALSAIWPGLGHFGHRTRRALLFANGTLMAYVFALGYVVATGTRTLLLWTVNVSALRILMVGSLVVLAFRSAVAVDAFRTADRRYWRWRHKPRRRVGTAVTLTLVAALIAAPHVVVIRLASVQLALLSDVFVATNTLTAAPTPLPTTSPTTSLPEAGEADPSGPIVPLTQATTPAPTTSTTATALAPAAQPQLTWDGASRLTIALLGSDAGFDRVGVRTDTIIVVSIDVATGDAAAFSVPRNWRHVTFPDGTAAAALWPDGYPEIVNEIYGLGLRHPEAFPQVDDPAGHAIKSALAQLTGLPIQYYVLLDMVGFVKVIDLFGGIDLYVSETIDERIKPIVADGPPVLIATEPGYHHFDGLTALGYVRARTGTTDWHRMTRQRCVVEALLDQVPRMELVYRYADLTDIIASHVSTDIPIGRLSDLMGMADRLDTSRIVTVNFIPPEFQPGDAPIAQVRAAVSQALEGRANTSNALLADSCRTP